MDGEEKEGREERDSFNKDTAPSIEQAPTLWATLPAMPEFWVVGSSGEVFRCRSATSERVQGKLPATQVGLEPLAFMNKELVHRL